MDESSKRRGKMKVLGNAAAFVLALTIIGGVMLAQRDYQNSWRDTGVVQMTPTDASSPAAPEQIAEYAGLAR